jgi:magnesium transporter
MSRTRLYRNGELVKEGFPLEDVSEYLKDQSALVWLDVHTHQLDEVNRIDEELGLHHLAVEDALQEHERSKLDKYASHLFLSCFAVTLDCDSGQLRRSGISGFIVPNALVTVSDEDFDIDEVITRWDDERELARYGVGFLVYGLIDYVVDTLLTATEALDEQLETLEDIVFEDRPADRELQRRTFELRKSLARIRRIGLPLREAVLALQRRDLSWIDSELDPYFRDVYDHVLRATEWQDSLRDLLTTLFETHLNARSNRLNVIVKQVTSWAAIIAVPTAVTGFFGQNVPYPGSGKAFGFWESTVVIIVLSGILYFTFKRKGWL